MRPLQLLLIAGLLGASSSSGAEPLEPPITKTTVQIEREVGGACSEIHAGKAGSRPAVAMTDVCHGWNAATCLDKLFIHGLGVVEDQGQVLFTENDDRSLDLVPQVDSAINKRWPGHEHLHLQFGNPTVVSLVVV